VLGSSNKIVVDTGKSAQGVVPYLPLNEFGLPAKPQPKPATTGGQR